MRYIFTFLIIIFIISCNSDSTGDELGIGKHDIDRLTVFSSKSEPKFSIRLINEQYFTENEEVFFSHIGDVAVDDRGRVLITEMSLGSRPIHQFESDGTYIGQLGSEGRGPGEYQTPVHLQVIRDKVYIYDNLLKRITIYSLIDLDVIRSVPVSPGDYMNSRDLAGLSPQNLFVLCNEEYVIGFGSYTPGLEENYTRYFGADPTGHIKTDQLFKLKAKSIFSIHDGTLSIQSLLPFDHDSFIYYRQNRFYTAWSEHFLIKIYDESGDLVRGIYYPVVEVPFRREDYVDNYMSPHLKRAVQYMDFPDYWPVLGDLLVDDWGRLWVAVITDDFEIYEWWVLENSGELMARFEWPRNKRIKDIKNGFLYTLELDPMVGTQEVVRYQIEFE